MSRCSLAIYHGDLAAKLSVCPKCAHHFRVNATERLRTLFDAGDWTEHDRDLTSTDPLRFTDTKSYISRLNAGFSQQREAARSRAPPLQRSEFLVGKGMLDLIVDRREMKAVLASALCFMGARRVAPPIVVTTPVAVPASEAESVPQG